MKASAMTLTPEEEGALLLLLWSVGLNGSDRSPQIRSLIRLLWRLETRAIMAGATVH